MALTYKIPGYDYEYEAELCERFHASLPARVFDAHFHLSPNEIAGSDKAFLVPEAVRSVTPEQNFDIYKSDTEQYLGKGRLVGGLLMGNPKCFQTPEALDEERIFSCETAAAHEGFVTGLLAMPWETPEKLVSFLERYPRIAALKPYRCYAQAPDTFEADIATYAPDWMWEVAEQYALPVVLHLSHYKNMLKDEANGRDIRRLSRAYPHAKIVLAHCALGHHPDKLRSGLAYLDGLDNVYMDCSGVSEALSIVYALRALGPGRVMYGSDGYHFGYMPGRVMAMGGNFLGIHKEPALPRDYRYHPLNNVCEGLLALTSACDLLSIEGQELEAIYYGTAGDLFYGACRQ